MQSQKPKAKSAVPRAQQQSLPANVSDVVSPEPSILGTRPLTTKTSLADWTTNGDEHDVGGFYASEKRQRGGRKKKKTNQERATVMQNWDDIYDPSRPNNYEDYKNSDEKIAEIRQWKDRLYAHRMARRRMSNPKSDSDDEYKPQTSSEYTPVYTTRPKIQTPADNFGPRSTLNFAPPSTFDSIPSATPPDDAAGEDADDRRFRLSQTTVDNTNNSLSVPSPSKDPSIAQVSNVVAPNPTLYRAPVRYRLPSPPPELPSSEAELNSALEAESGRGTEAELGDKEDEDAPRSLRPGQKGFAERLMSKYGWSKGSGLGVSESGIINPLRVQVGKQKKKPDSEGGGFAGPRTGTILGGRKKANSAREGGKFGIMSEVVVLDGMVDGLDLDAEMRDEDGGLMQEIGEECSEKYGLVERVFIDRRNPSKAPVFVKFTSQLSALRVSPLSPASFVSNGYPDLTARL